MSKIGWRWYLGPSSSHSFWISTVIEQGPSACHTFADCVGPRAYSPNDSAGTTTEAVHTALLHHRGPVLLLHIYSLNWNQGLMCPTFGQVNSVKPFLLIIHNPQSLWPLKSKDVRQDHWLPNQNHQGKLLVPSTRDSTLLDLEWALTWIFKQLLWWLWNTASWRNHWSVWSLWFPSALEP